MARPRKYSSRKALAEAVDRYFASLTREVSEPNKRCVAVYDEEGALHWREYLLPPSLSGLCLYLGVDKSTWARWAGDKALGPVAAEAKLRVEHYLETELVRRKKSTRGVEFSLQNNFGWRDKMDVSAEVAPPVVFKGDADVPD